MRRNLPINTQYNTDMINSKFQYKMRDSKTLVGNSSSAVVCHVKVQTHKSANIVTCKA